MKKTIKVSDKKFKIAMKLMKFSDGDLFLKYCVLNTIKSKVSAAQRKQVLKEMKEIKNAEKLLQKK